MAFSFFFRVWKRRIGPIFSLPNLLSTSQVRLQYLTAADTNRRSHSPLPPGTTSSILFAKHVSFEHSVSSPCLVITSRREENINNKAKVFSAPNRQSYSHSASSCLISSRPALRGRCCRSRPWSSEVISNKNYLCCSYIQTDNTHCWP